MRTHIIGLFIVGIAARAGADPLVAANPLSTDPQSGVAVDVGEPRLTDRSGLPDHALHFDFGVGSDLGHINAGDMTAIAGLHMLFGPRIGRVALLAELDLAATQSRENAKALDVYQRVALETRVSLWQGRVGGLRLSGPPTEVSRADLWIEPGIGYEMASQMNMTSLARSDVSLAIGFQRTFHYESRTFGGYVALRVMEAEPVPGERGHDLSVLLTSGVVFGR